MRRVYNTADISVIVGSREDLIGPRFTSLLDPDIGIGIRYMTDDEKELGKNRNFAGSNDIVIYFLHSVIPGFASGMAYIENAGAVVKFASSLSTLAHEVAHVLGLGHTREQGCPNPEPCTNALMDNCWRCFGDKESTLNPDEIRIMRGSDYTFECGP